MASLLQRAVERLQKQGGRMTAQRRMLLKILDRRSDHPTAEELYALAKEQDANIHLSTVYRTLRWLQGEGLVSSRWFEEERRHERFDPNWPADHHHFLCVACQRVIEFDDPMMVREIQIQFESRYGAQVESASLILYGLCPDCRGGRDALGVAPDRVRELSES